MSRKVFISHAVDADSDLVRAFRETSERAGLEVIGTDDAGIVPSDLVSSRHDAIARCQTFIALLDRLNPNIMLELGFALGAGKNVVVAAAPNVTLPSDLTAIPYVQLTANVGEIISSLRRELARTQERSRETVGIEAVTADVVRQLAHDPSRLAALSAKQFEEVVATIMSRFGYEVHLATNGLDGGCDLIARSLNPPTKILVEAKRYAPQRLVSVEHVLRLAGVTDAANASGGLLVTTSGFTSSARKFAEVTRPPIRLMTAEELLGVRSRLQLVPESDDEA
jgi:hypothetical protein